MQPLKWSRLKLNKLKRNIKEVLWGNYRINYS